MKFIKLLILFLSIPTFFYGQDTTYLDIDKKKVKSIENATYYKVTTFSENKKYSLERIYFKSGVLKEEINKERKTIKNKIDNTSKQVWFTNGNEKEWYESGKLYKEQEYIKEDSTKRIRLYWPNEKLKREDIFEKGRLECGLCYDSLGNKVKHFPYEQMAKYPGGDTELFKFLGKNIAYPVYAQENNIQGRVIVQFVVTVLGEIENVKVIRSIDFSLDREALRIVSLMPKWIPGNCDGKPIRVKYTLPINFRLPQNED